MKAFVRAAAIREIAKTLLLDTEGTGFSVYDLVF